MYHILVHISFSVSVNVNQKYKTFIKSGTGKYMTAKLYPLITKMDPQWCNNNSSERKLIAILFD